MKNFEISRYPDGCIYAVTLFGKFIDFRHWYQIKNDYSGTTTPIWTDTWNTYDEIQESIKETPGLIYRKIPLWLKLNLDKDTLKFLGIVTAAFTFGVLITKKKK